MLQLIFRSIVSIALWFVGTNLASAEDAASQTYAPGIGIIGQLLVQLKCLGSHDAVFRHAARSNLIDGALDGVDSSGSVRAEEYRAKPPRFCRAGVKVSDKTG